MPTDTQTPSPARVGSRVDDAELRRWFWRGHVRGWRWWIAAGLCLMAIDGAMVGALSYMLQPMFDQVLVAGNESAIVWVATAIGAVFLLRATTSFLYRTMMAYVSERVITGLQGQIAEHVARLDQGFHHDHPPGHLIERVRGDTQEISIVFTRLIPGIGRDAVSIVALLGVALWTDWVWTLVALIGVPLLVLPTFLVQRLVRRFGLTARETSAQASSRLDEMFHGVVTIQRLNREQVETDRLRSVLRRYVRAKVRTEAGTAAMGSLSDIVGALGFALVLLLAGGQIVAGERTVGEFMTFFAAIAFLFEPLRRLGSLAGAWQTVLASLERIHRLLAEVPRIVQPAAPITTLPPRGEETVELRNVDFAYGTEPVLRNLSLTARAGQVTALVGPSGAGKSTVFTLLTRLADPQGGQVLVGGQDVSRMDLVALRGLFSVVAQDSALFDETLRDNILMGAGDVSDEALMQAVRDAHVDEFLPQLPLGLDTRVGPRGSALSGGQRQRVAIARALLRPAPILLLDEATSALDARSESLVQEALDRLSRQRTTLVIAHRLATVRRADRIIVLDAGSVAEEGRHEELLAQGGIYARLHALQFARDDAPPQT